MLNVKHGESRPLKGAIRLVTDDFILAVKLFGYMQAQIERISGDRSRGDAGERLSSRLLWLHGLHAASHQEVRFSMIATCAESCAQACHALVRLAILVIVTHNLVVAVWNPEIGLRISEPVQL